MKIGASVSFKAFSINNSINNLSFGAKFSLGIRPDISNDEFIKQQQELDKEAKQTQKAAQWRVKVPKYDLTKTPDGNHIKQIRYETLGENPDIQNNPVRHKHLRNLFNNLYLMDRAGIFHNDLDKSHIFLGKNGEVEFDCFRYSLDFHRKYNGETEGNDGSIRTPDFMFPSNEDTFREHFLGEYVNSMDDDKKHYFMDGYLRERSNYHAKRGDLLVNRGFHLNNKAVQYEDIQAEVFFNPSNPVTNYEIKKLEAAGLKRQAFTEWDEGGGACGHKINPKRRFEAILINLECIDAVAELRNEAKILSKQALTEAERKYFAFEEEYAQKRLDDLCSDTKGMGAWNFNDTNNGIFLGTQDEKEWFFLLFDDIDTSDLILSSKFREIEEYYSGLIKKWDENLNKSNRLKFGDA